MKTDITVILDRSGSMEAIKSDTIGGYNQMVTDQKAAPGDASMTLVQFDTAFDTVFAGTPIQQVQPLTPATFVPRGSTALYDAIGRTVIATGIRLSALPEADRPAKVVCVIITDGQENSSKEFTREKIFEMISHQQDVYKWEFMFLGANQDAIGEAQQIGIPVAAAMDYSPTSAGIAGNYAVASANLLKVRGGGKVEITAEERAQAKGDDWQNTLANGNKSRVTVTVTK